MAAGVAVTANEINSKAGALVTNLWNALNDVRNFKLWLDDSIHNDSYLTALGFSAPDIAAIRNAYADLGGASGLYSVAHGSFAPAGASNYFFNAKALTGTNYSG